MLRIPCPKCRRNVYAPDVEGFHPCPYCGIVFSGKFGPEKRREERTPRKIRFRFSFQGRDFDASTIDLSRSGAAIRISGKPPLSEGDRLNLRMSGPPVEARVMWLKAFADQTLAGLQKIPA